MAKTPEFDLRKARKNYLINGDMRISQRQVTFTGIANGAYSLDRYVYYKVGAMVHTITQGTDVPTLTQAGYLFQNCLRLNLTTPDTAIAATDVCAITQKIEGYNFTALAQKPFTLSFWVKATLPGTYCVAFQNSANDRSYVAEYTINAASTWEYKTITVAASPSAGTWNYSTGIGLEVNWTLAAGSNFQQTAGSWQTNAGAKYATANQINGVNTGATDFRITGVMLNEGVEALPFSLFAGDIEGEFAACQRYFEKSYPEGFYATATSVNGYCAVTVPAGTVRATFPFKVKKRTTPSYTPYSVVLGTINNVSKDVSGNIAITGVQGVDAWGGGVEFVQTAGDLRAYWHFYAEAEL